MTLTQKVKNIFLNLAADLRPILVDLLALPNGQLWVDWRVEVEHRRVHVLRYPPEHLKKVQLLLILVGGEGATCGNLAWPISDIWY